MNVLFFVHPGTNSRRIFLDMAQGIATAGCKTMFCELGALWEVGAKAGAAGSAARAAAMQRASDQVAALIRNHQIDVSISMWSNAVTTLSPGVRNGRPMNFFESIESPHVMFWLDAPHWAHEGALRSAIPSPLFNNHWLHHLINNEATAVEMTEILGFGNVFSLPYAINEEVFRPRQSEVGNPRFDIAFGLGPGDQPPTELMRKELANDDPDMDAIRRDQATHVNSQLQPIIDRVASEHRKQAAELAGALIESQLQSPQQPMLHRLRAIVESGRASAAVCDALLRNPALYIDLTMAIRAIDNWQRAFTICHLARHFRCAIFGSPTLDGWDCPAQRLGQLEYDAQALAYSQARIGLNVMRWQDDVGLNLKPFEISACGVPCAMAHRPGVELCFDVRREIITFQSPGEARQKVRALLDDESARRSIAEAALQRVRTDHTWTVRSRDILDQLAPAMVGIAPVGV